MRRVELPQAENGLPLSQSDRRLYKIEKFCVAISMGSKYNSSSGDLLTSDWTPVLARLQSAISTARSCM
jgi:hypothetical protein